MNKTRDPVSNIHIRPASISDKEFMLSLLPRLTEFGPPMWRDSTHMIEVDTRILADKLINKNPGTAIFVAHDENGNRLGFIHLHPGKDYYYSEKHGHISDVIVAPEGKGRGIGRALIVKAEEWARCEGYKWLTLSVFSQNINARNIYKKLGFGEDIIKYVKEIE